MDFASTTRAAENRTTWKLIYDTPTTLHGHGIANKRAMMALDRSSELSLAMKVMPSVE